MLSKTATELRQETLFRSFIVYRVHRENEVLKESLLS